MLLAFDLDGTIVTRKYELPAQTREAIDYARSKGHQVTVITGRTDRSSRPYLTALDVPSHFGSCQGSRVHGVGEEMLHEVYIGAEEVLKTLSLLKRHRSAKFFMTSPTHMFLKDPEDPFFSWSKDEGHTVQTLEELTPETVNKIVIYGKDLSKLSAKIHAEVHGQFYPWDHTVLEVLPHGSSKGHALSLLAEHHGYGPEDVIAFGDGVNDISMFEWAGTGIAVGFAGEHLRSLAKEHVPEPEKLGVVQWIYANL
ncbi:Cof-type HAD-IIB family hydrolase [Deinococcus cellulosilyticus]|uniref:Pyridoxal phosphatase n=1 Tax=Deinococcus cellulosilyticus (strain DSM 18568 / NBRC 106333 / KACC 11606 / 5516J-15) TaxID=1223518 RepID=A0A511MYJ4_DEIC1|nr:HAD family hydrolase [Deinococcus cellulosilyticus]GEM45216.1 pyridoxal phosphatase [Deinococcus cellulosilyticus NBRC 106333 = KACC 11606]